MGVWEGEEERVAVAVEGAVGSGGAEGGLEALAGAEGATSIVARGEDEGEGEAHAVCVSNALPEDEAE